MVIDIINFVKLFSQFNHRHSELVKIIIKRYKKVGYNKDIKRKYACLVAYQITVYIYGFLFQYNFGRHKDLSTLISDKYPWPCILMSI